jgi:RnfABCDGE-type electron transport complex C subunit
VAKRAENNTDRPEGIRAPSGDGREESLAELQRCGVVGMGGAGFPTHVKLDASVDTVVANGAECEPLLWADKSLLLRWPDEVLDGLEIAMELTGASRAVLAMKKKYRRVVETVERAVELRNRAGGGRIELHLLSNTYPAGDEHVLVKQVVGRTIPELGLPLDVGVVVSNVATLRAVSRCLRRGEPVTSRLVTVLGEVAEPKTVDVPIGTPIEEVLAAAGGPTIEDYYYVVGGAMMGELTRRGDVPVLKTTSGLFVLPPEHPAVKRRLQDPASALRLARAACCRCMQCTDVCPRNTLGHRLYPDRLMRSMAAGITHDMQAYRGAYLCCECGLCTVYGCPMYLDPCGMNIQIKRRLREAGVEMEPVAEPDTDRFFEIKQVPLTRLVARLELTRYEVEADSTARLEARRVHLALKQGAGAPAKPTVRPGKRVERGEQVAEPGGRVSAAVHASIDGVVESVSDEAVVITRGGKRQ